MAIRILYDTLKISTKYLFKLMKMVIVIELKEIYGETAELNELPQYLERILGLVAEGNEVVLTGAAPVWLYLKAAHALHGKVAKLVYRSPVAGDLVIFDHSPF